MNPEQLTTAFPHGAGGLPSVRLAQIGESVSARLETAQGIEKVPVPGIEMFARLNFLSEADCQVLVRLIDANSRPSTLLSQIGDDQFRTSFSCDLDRWDPQVHAIDLRICKLMGIDPVLGETLQGQRYAPGQQFKAHHDFFHTDQPYWVTEQPRGGQRSWTAMIYLNQPEAGGDTNFPQAGINVSARTGMLLAWNNMGPDGAPNRMTLHAGMPVEKGLKHVVTKWFRELPWV